MSSPGEDMRRKTLDRKARRITETNFARGEKGGGREGGGGDT